MASLVTAIASLEQSFGVTSFVRSPVRVPVDEDPRTKQTEPSHLSLRPELSHLSLPLPNFSGLYLRRFQLLPRLSSASREKTQGRFKYLPGQVRAFQMLAGGTSITPMFQADKAAFDEAEKKREEVAS